MPECDLVLLHAPSVYDFRQEAILYGPVADFVPVPFAFEGYPLGYTGLVEYMERGGYRVCTLNLAAAMLDNPQFDAEAAIAAQSARFHHRFSLAGARPGGAGRGSDCEDVSSRNAGHSAGVCGHLLSP